MDLRFAHQVYVRHRVLLRRMVLAAFLLSLLAAYGLPSSFTAVARVTVIPGESRFTFLQVPGQQPTLATATPVQTTMQTYAQIIKSRAVAEKVVEELKLDQLSDQGSLAAARSSIRHGLDVAWTFIQYGEYHQLSRHEAAIRGVQASLTPTAVLESWILEIRARADSADLAVLIANSAARQTINVVNDLAARDATERLAHADKLVRQATADAQDADQQLATFQQKYGTSGLDDATQQLVQRLAEIDTEVAMVSDRLVTGQTNLANLDQSASSKSTASSTVASENQALQKQRNDLLQLRSQVLAQINLAPEPKAQLAALLARQSSANQAQTRALAEQRDAQLQSSRGDLALQNLEAAQPPNLPSGTPRGLTVGVALLASLLLWVIGAFSYEGARLALSRTAPA